MISRICPKCGLPCYSADTTSEWECPKCGTKIPVPEGNK